MEVLISGGTLVIPGRGTLDADLLLRNGRIVGPIERGSSRENAERIIDAHGLHVMPGVVDPHVHIGLGAGLDDWQTETASAAIGGVTTVISFLMAGNSYIPLIEEALAAARQLAFIDFAFHLVPCAPVHLEEFDRYVREFGVTSFKYFTSFRGDEGSYLGVTGTDDGFLFEFLEHAAAFNGVVASIHPENIEVVWLLRARLKAAGRNDLSAWNESRPDSVEAECTFRALYYGRDRGCPIYLVHVSSLAAINEIRAWKARFPIGDVYVETCPQYLTHTSSMPIGSLGKVNPPLREDADREALWIAIADGTVDTIGSDHVPRRREKKSGSIWTASAGFPGTATILPVLLSEGHHARGITLQRIAEMTSANPARTFGIYPRKGSLMAGADADLTLVDLNLEQRATADVLHSYADYSLYEDRILRGWPVMTLVRGEVVMEDRRLVGKPGHGLYLHRTATLRGENTNA